MVIKSFILSLIILFASSNVVLAEEVQTIVHSSVNKQEFSRLELRRIFSRKQTLWPNGHPIVVFVLANKNELHQRFSKEVLRIFPYQLDRIWNKLTYSGIGTGPVIVKTRHQLIEAVKNTPGAIGYGEGISDKEKEAVHVINIQD